MKYAIEQQGKVSPNAFQPLHLYPTEMSGYEILNHGLRSYQWLSGSAAMEVSSFGCTYCFMVRSFKYMLFSV